MEKISCVQRRRYILNKLEKDEQVIVSELSNLFSVSEVTIRKDLKHFEKKNMLIRSRGGAMKQSIINTDLSIYDRRKQNIRLKKAIGSAAAQMIKPGDTILLDTGTTIMELAKHLPKNIELTIITNSVDIAFRLADYPNIKVIMPGGTLRKNSIALIGELAVESLRNYYCDKYFLSADAVNSEIGLMTTNIEEATIAKININNSNKVIALVDSTKFQRKGTVSIADLTKIDVLITDSAIQHDVLQSVEKKGVEVIIADSS